MAEDKMKNLEIRIQELENELKGLRASRRELQDISADELRAYFKVKDTLVADWGEFCGINDCMVCRICSVQPCRVCVAICQVCQVCDVECTCGPCNVGGLMERQVGRFRKLGQ
jgi:hypothetical protein